MQILASLLYLWLDLLQESESSQLNVKLFISTFSLTSSISHTEWQSDREQEIDRWIEYINKNRIDRWIDRLTRVAVHRRCWLLSLVLSVLQCLYTPWFVSSVHHSTVFIQPNLVPSLSCTHSLQNSQSLHLIWPPWPLTSPTENLQSPMGVWAMGSS